MRAVRRANRLPSLEADASVKDVLLQAERARRKGLLREAEALCWRLITQVPEPRPLALLAEVLGDAGMPETGIRFALQAAELPGAGLRVLRPLMTLGRQLKNTDDAERQYTRLLADTTREAETRAVAGRWLALCLIAREQTEEAWSVLASLPAAGPAADAAADVVRALCRLESSAAESAAAEAASLALNAVQALTWPPRGSLGAAPLAVDNGGEDEPGDSLAALANALRRRGEVETAARLLDAVLDQRPKHRDALSARGGLRRARGFPLGALADFDAVLALDPQDRAARNGRTGALRDLNQPEEALANQRLLTERPDVTPEERRAMASVLRDLGRMAEAEEELRAALAMAPKSPGLRCALASLLRVRGDLVAAEAEYRKVIAEHPGFSEAYRGLSVLTTLKEGDPALHSLLVLAERAESQPVRRRIALHYALGKANEDLGQYPQALRHYVQGGALKRRFTPYDPEGDAAFHARLRDSFPEGFLNGWDGGSDSRRPVFVVGMPRSGTTLIEQIIASHPLAHGAGELKLLGGSVDGMGIAGRPFRLGGRRRLQAGHPRAEDGEGATESPQAEALRRAGRYLAGIDRLAPAGAERVVDKMPDNYRLIGFIRLLFPHAAIIHCQRDPVDTCLSCFRLLFTEGQEWSYDLEDLARHYGQYHGLMAHWHRVLPADPAQGGLIAVRYENVVADLEGEARRLIAACGLPWDDACLAFHQSDRPVATASASQVRKPIYASSIGRYARYGEGVNALVENLKPYVF